MRDLVATVVVYVFLIFFVSFGRPVVSRSIPELPSYLKICHHNDPNLNECVKNSVESLKPYLKKGIPALQIPACEPLYIPRIEINQAAGPISVKSTYNDIKIKGATNFVLKSIKVDTEKDHVKLKLFMPRLEMIANYNMDGKILMLPIIGDGLARGNYTDVDIVVMIQGERYQDRRTKMTHYRVTDFYLDFEIGHTSMHLENLFNGDETLAEAMNLFLNNNWKMVAAEIKPALEETISDLFKTFSNQIYSKYPIDTLLPP